MADCEGWTHATLLAHVVAMLEAHEKLDAARHHAQEVALTKAETAAEKRFESVNEFRAQAADRDALFITKTEVYPRFDGLAERINELSARLDKAEGRGTGIKDIVAWVVAAMMAAIAIFAAWRAH